MLFLLALAAYFSFIRQFRKEAIAVNLKISVRKEMQSGTNTVIAPARLSHC
jgi:hypothetical protein